MKASIAGMAWVTPLGADLDTVWAAIRAGAAAEVKPVQNPETTRVLSCRPVPAKLVEHLARNPRLRRSSPISYFAVAAAQAALAQVDQAATPSARTALVFAVSDGGVIYTRRFYDQIVKQGANAASPLLFPETVYNAPASHLSAALGTDGATYTLVGDNSVGLTALHFGAQLLAMGEADRVVVVGCEEIDWILCEAFHDWRLSGTPLAEGAGALVLVRDGTITLDVAPAVSFAARRDAGAALEKAAAAFSSVDAEVVISCANGTFIDAAEKPLLGSRPVVRIKDSLGEAPGASALWQVIAGAQAIRVEGHRSVLIPAVGFNQQAAVARLSTA